jgi:hypothetical protein
MKHAYISGNISFILYMIIIFYLTLSILYMVFIFYCYFIIFTQRGCSYNIVLLIDLVILKIDSEIMYIVGNLYNMHANKYRNYYFCIHSLYN